MRTTGSGALPPGFAALTRARTICRTARLERQRRRQDRRAARPKRAPAHLKPPVRAQFLLFSHPYKVVRVRIFLFSHPYNFVRVRFFLFPHPYKVVRVWIFLFSHPYSWPLPLTHEVSHCYLPHLTSGRPLGFRPYHSPFSGPFLLLPTPARSDPTYSGLVADYCCCSP